MAKEEVKKDAKEETPVKEEKETKKEKKKLFDNKDEKIDELKKAVEEYKDKYYRAIADLDNQRKQYEKEYRQTVKYSSQHLAEKLLPSFEMFSMVVNYTDNLPPEVKAYCQGFDMVYRQMVQALESEGVSEITCKVGDEFDHKIHAAMETCEVEDKKDDNKITKIISKGYMIHDRLLKPVTVIVGKLKDKVVVEEANLENNEEENNKEEANA